MAEKLSDLFSSALPFVSYSDQPENDGEAAHKTSSMLGLYLRVHFVRFVLYQIITGAIRCGLLFALYYTIVYLVQMQEAGSAMIQMRYFRFLIGYGVFELALVIAKSGNVYWKVNKDA
jgi:hypothetical protein